jgi:hypothetical protein
MDFAHLEECGVGLVPNVEERAALETEMRRRRADEKLERCARTLLTRMLVAIVLQ